MAAPKKKVRTRRRERKNIERGAVHISSSFNNTMVTIAVGVGYRDPVSYTHLTLPTIA